MNFVKLELIRMILTYLNVRKVTQFSFIIKFAVYIFHYYFIHIAKAYMHIYYSILMLIICVTIL